MRHRSLPLLKLLIALALGAAVPASADEPHPAAPVRASETGLELFTKITEVIARLDSASLWEAVTQVERPAATSLTASVDEKHGIAEAGEQSKYLADVMPVGLEDSALLEQTWKFLDYLGHGMRLASELDGILADDAAGSGTPQEASPDAAYSVRDRALRLVRDTHGGLVR